MSPTPRMGTQPTGKLAEIVQSATRTEICTIKPSRRLCVTDLNTGLHFLVDTGADISLLPVQNKQRAGECSDLKLFAANGSEIKTYGVKVLTLDLRLRRPYKWEFVIADVKQPILGADFLSHHKLVVNLTDRKLHDLVTFLNITAPTVRSNQPTINTVNGNHPYHDLLLQFPSITKPPTYKETPTHNVVHHIETTGAPTFARARPLPPDRYKKVKEEFRRMQELGICRPSKSQWASPLTVVTKKERRNSPLR
ncbi:uncharacterized protein K02A2.6-like [Leguminivora glycinivorella]|uniref:uncharacterized protein K02A2.6-like n=1 Tax=Leguminivora glycinivorella TaxID=1035111 RepID=UPI00200E2394|nr:uncharacterized protein K02A2.6-like [Leguminivora glycinivorella]